MDDKHGLVDNRPNAARTAKGGFRAALFVCGYGTKPRLSGSACPVRLMLAPQPKRASLPAVEPLLARVFFLMSMLAQ
jgi:hypothetical protein